MSQTTVKSLLKMIDSRISHIEDMTADNREIIVKLVKQSNQIVDFFTQNYGFGFPIIIWKVNSKWCYSYCCMSMNFLANHIC